MHSSNDNLWLTCQIFRRAVSLTALRLISSIKIETNMQPDSSGLYTCTCRYKQYASQLVFWLLCGYDVIQNEIKRNENDKFVFIPFQYSRYKPCYRMLWHKHHRHSAIRSYPTEHMQQPYIPNFNTGMEQCRS